MHPEEQVKEIIRYLKENKEQVVCIITVSPYILQAIRVYVKNYPKEYTAEYYLAECNRELKLIKTKGNILMKELTKPFMKLVLMRDKFRLKEI